jgi:hypothetical protein
VLHGALVLDTTGCRPVARMVLHGALVLDIVPLLLLAGTLATAAAQAPPAGYSSTVSPFYSDPLFGGAHDAELVWHEAEQCWWLTYLQNRYDSCARGGHATGSTTGTDLGLASTPDGGRTWVYRGVMAGLDVPANDRHEPLPPGARTAQFGGATWWRPAVTTVDSVYHGFFSYWEQTHEWGLWKVVHYTSTDLKNWRFKQFVRNSTCPKHATTTANCTTAYDSVVFRVRDGRHVLLSAGPSPGFTGPHPPLLCSSDAQLMQWEACENSLQLYRHLPSLKASVGAEGAHVIGRNASVSELFLSESPPASSMHTSRSDGWRTSQVTFEEFSWMNWEGRGPGCNRSTGVCKPGTPNLARSSDGGLSWEASPTNLWGDVFGTRFFDAGMVAFQGPLLLQGSELFALYFTEGTLAPGNLAPGSFANDLPGCAARTHCRGVSAPRRCCPRARPSFT